MVVPPIYLVVLIVYAVTFFGLAKKDFPLTMFGVIGLFFLAVFIAVNGLGGFENFMSTIFAMITFALAAYIGLRGPYEWYKTM